MPTTRMSLSKHRVVVFAAAAIFIAAGAWHGKYTGRWSKVRVASEWPKLVSLPNDLEEWTGVDQPIEQSQLKVAEIEDYLARVYRNDLTGMEISVFVLAGRSGAISVHTPDVCFSGAGLKQFASLPDSTISESQNIHRFHQASFGRESNHQAEMVVAWGWTDNGVWETPANPRWHYAQTPRIFKIYISRTTIDPVAGSEKQWEEFTSRLLPQIRKFLFAWPGAL